MIHMKLPQEQFKLNAIKILRVIKTKRQTVYENELLTLYYQIFQDLVTAR